jgi:O-antigen ligase
VVQTDRDEPWAHNDFLQLGAETGLVGFLLLVGIFLWGFARLSAVESPDTVVVLGAVALAVLGVHACVEYVLQFPAVVLGASALVGTAVGAGDPRRRPY